MGTAKIVMSVTKNVSVPIFWQLNFRTSLSYKALLQSYIITVGNNKNTLNWLSLCLRELYY